MFHIGIMIILLFEEKINYSEIQQDLISLKKTCVH